MTQVQTAVSFNWSISGLRSGKSSQARPLGEVSPVNVSAPLIMIGTWTIPPRVDGGPDPLPVKVWAWDDSRPTLRGLVMAWRDENGFGTYAANYDVPTSAEDPTPSDTAPAWMNGAIPQEGYTRVHLAYGRTHPTPTTLVGTDGNGRPRILTGAFSAGVCNRVEVVSEVFDRELVLDVWGY